MLAGARLYPPATRESLITDEEALLCAAKRTVLDTAVVGVTEYYNVSVCLLFHTMGWQSLFDSCCGHGLAEGLQCPALTDKLTANVRDTRAESKVAAAASSNYSTRCDRRSRGEGRPTTHTNRHKSAFRRQRSRDGVLNLLLPPTARRVVAVEWCGVGAGYQSGQTERCGMRLGAEGTRSLG